MPSALFVHNSFPSQFEAVAQALVAREWQCAAIAREHASSIPELKLVQYRPKRGRSRNIFPPAAKVEEDMLCGAHAAESAIELRNSGFTPDVIIGHPGWGETLFLREIFPTARIISYVEYYYNPRGGDADFDPEFYQPSGRFDLIVRSKSAALALAYLHSDLLVAPTQFQASTLPIALRSRTHVVHEGIDTDRVRRRLDAALDLPDGRRLDQNTPVITFASRTLEPHRGFHRFMRALPDILSNCPRAHVVIVGDDEGPGYGQRPLGSTTWKQRMLTEVGSALDLSRVHFLGTIARETYLDVLSISTAHVYFTYPFTLSWSLTEAMSLGCVIVGSDNPPVTEAISSNESGILVGFFDHRALVNAITSICQDPGRFEHLRRGARAVAVAKYDKRSVCLPAWLGLIDNILRMDLG